MADRREQRATCPTCHSKVANDRGIIKMDWTGGAGRVNLHTERWSCADPWHESSPGAEEGATPHSSVIYTDLRVKCQGCGGYAIWRYLEDEDTIEVFHECSARAGVAATVETPPEEICKQKNVTATAVGEPSMNGGGNLCSVCGKPKFDPRTSTIASGSVGKVNEWFCFCGFGAGGTLQPASSEEEKKK